MCYHGYMISFTRIGNIPSKKNRWRRGANGNVYIPPEVKSELDDFLWQLKKPKADLGPAIESEVVIRCIFAGQMAKDLDNMTTTLLDLLQSAEIIKNDRQVVEIHTQKGIRAPGETDALTYVQIESHRPEQPKLSKKTRRAKTMQNN